MIVEPEQRVADFAKAGADIISVHVEQQSTIHLHRTVNMIKDLGCKAGIVLNPATPLSAIEYVVDVADLILVMSVNPGFGGQKFIESQVQKIREIKALCNAKVGTLNGCSWVAYPLCQRQYNVAEPSAFQTQAVMHTLVSAFFSGEVLSPYRQAVLIILLHAFCLQGVNPWIEVDGGVGPDNAYKVIEAGANAIVAGSAVFKAPNYKDGECFVLGKGLHPGVEEGVKLMHSSQLMASDPARLPPRPKPLLLQSSATSVAA
eukprot:4278-Pelagomonas_calceolata.AAC.11